jgi:MFS transporter, ACS family, D-galactonate transporter
MQIAARRPAEPDPEEHSKPVRHWLLLALLVVSICINYVDRGSVSVAAKGIADDLSLDANDLGKLFSAFFWTYAAFQMIAGWAIDRYNVYRVYGYCFAAWSVATTLTGAASGFATIFGLRLLLGTAESVAYPAYSKIIAAGFAEEERGRANAFIDAGSKLGPALGMLVGGTITAYFGWRAMFLAIGAGSLLWLIPWRAVAPRTFTKHRDHIHDGPALLDILRRREAWGTFLGLFCSNWAWYFMLTWLPPYFIRERHFSQTLMATYGSLPFWAVAISSVVGGILSDRWISKGSSPTRVRKTFVIGGLLGATIILPAAIVQSPHAAMLLLITSSASFGCFSSNIWAVTQTLAGPGAAGKWSGIQNTFGNIAGILAPRVTGWIVFESGSFYWAFVLSATMLVLGACSFLFLVGKVAPLRWNSAKSVEM